MRTTAIFNFKGGTAKTITTLNMAAELAARGNHVCVIDADPQCNATEFLLPTNAEIKTTIYDILCNPPDICDWYLPMKSRWKNIEVVPSDENLCFADLAALKGGMARSDQLAILAQAFAEEGWADYVLIDCPPGFTAATVAALAAADDVVIPMKLDAFSIRGEENLVRQISGMREFNPRLRVAGVLVTMNDSNTVVSRQGLELLRESAIPVFDTTISRATAVDQSTFIKTPLRLYPQAKKIAKEYSRFIDEYMKGGASRG